MYLNCKNSLQLGKDDSDQPDAIMMFGERKYPIIEVFAECSATQLSSHIKNSDQKIYCFSACDDEIAKTIVDFISGKDITIDSKNVAELFRISIEVGVIEIIEACAILQNADRKIREGLKRLITGSKDESLLDFSARFFDVFTLYEQFLDIPIQVMDSILSRKYLGIQSESHLFDFLISYQKHLRQSNPEEKESNSLFKRVNKNAFSKEDSVRAWKDYREAFNEMKNAEHTFPTRILITNPKSEKGFRTILTQIINTKL